MSENLEEKFIEERLKHEKSERDLFEQPQQLKAALYDIEEIVKNTCRKRCTNDCLGTKKYCGYGKILQKIKEIKQDGNS